jgi:hypothetical protein
LPLSLKAIIKGENEDKEEEEDPVMLHHIATSEMGNIEIIISNFHAIFSCKKKSANYYGSVMN